VRRRGAAVFATVALLAAGCARPRLVRDGAVDRDGLTAVERSIVAIRGRALAEPVPAVVLDPAALRAMIAADFAASHAAGDVARIEAVYGRLGLLPAGTRLQPLVERLYEAEGAAFYDPRGRRLVLASRPVPMPLVVRMIGFLSGRDLAGEMIVAHELVHAIQDQHWGLPITPEPLVEAHGDCRLARRAVLEGDATLAGFGQVLGGGPDAGAARAIARELRRLPEELRARHPDVPPALLASLAVQYEAGTVFVARALAEGGWDAVDRLHDDPPTSTEQVLHPERYYERRDAPRAVALGGTDALVSAGFGTVLEDTLGELLVRALAERAASAERAAATARGWGGDRLRALTRGEELVLVWLTTWDTRADADEWEAALPALLPDAHVARRGAEVLAVLTPPDVPAAPLAAAVLAASRLGPDRGCPVDARPPGQSGRPVESASHARYAAEPASTGSASTSGTS
jgi:hypothetical protein